MKTGKPALLEDAIEIAVRAHRGCKDRAGQPYILHPLRLMCRMDTETEKIAAVLHDVVEDSNWTLAKLCKRGFPKAVLDALDCLTERDGEVYPAFIRRIACNTLARKIKVADLEDNMDVRRLKKITADGAKRLKRYLRAWQFLSMTQPSVASAPRD